MTPTLIYPGGPELHVVTAHEVEIWTPSRTIILKQARVALDSQARVVHIFEGDEHKMTVSIDHCLVSWQVLDRDKGQAAPNVPPVSVAR